MTGCVCSTFSHIVKISSRLPSWAGLPDVSGPRLAFMFIDCIVSATSLSAFMQFCRSFLWDCF